MQPRDLRLCFVGDSFVAGLGDRTALGWTGRVTAAAIGHGEQHGYALTAYNLGVRRDTSQDIAARTRTETTPRLSPATDPRVVLSFGVNDTTLADHGRPRAAVEHTVQALHRIHESLPSGTLFFVGPPAIDDDRQNDRIAALSARLAHETAGLGVPFVETFSATSQNVLWRTQIRDGDGAHPDAGGYELLARLVTAPLLAWLTVPPAPASHIRP